MDDELCEGEQVTRRHALWPGKSKQVGGKANCVCSVGSIWVSPCSASDFSLFLGIP